jgi:hypothetical protein
MTFEYLVGKTPRNKFIGEIKANINEPPCFTPRLVTDDRKVVVVGKRTKAADVLQILKTKLGLSFPMGDKPITIFDGAKNGEWMMISPFYLLRGGDAFYEKYGYKSAIIHSLKEMIRSATWGSLSAECRAHILEFPGKKKFAEGFADSTSLVDIMNLIPWEDEESFCIANERTFSYRLFRLFALSYGYSFESTNQMAIDSIWEFTLDRTDPKWQQCERDLVFTLFEPIVGAVAVAGGALERKRSKKTRGRFRGYTRTRRSLRQIRANVISRS